MSNPYKATTNQEANLRKEMTALVDILFALYGDEASFDEIGRQAKLHPNTVRNLWGGVTQFPQFRTVHKLAAGVGVSIEINSDQLTMSLNKSK